jgi:hypothetical protein
MGDIARDSIKILAEPRAADKGMKNGTVWGPFLFE